MDGLPLAVVVVFLALGTGCGAVVAQPVPPADPAPALPGTAVLHLDPVSADTLPILCHDAERPEAGFVTETTDPEWTPRVGLSFWPAPDGPEEWFVRIDWDGTAWSTSFQGMTPSNEGVMTVVAWVVRPDGSGERQISFTAHCRERLVRGP